jgi:hypothetical protein
MVLDPLTAIGLAGNIVQFIDFSLTIVSKASEIRQSADGVPRENHDLEIVTKNLVAITARLTNSVRPPEEPLISLRSSVDWTTYGDIVPTWLAS